MKAKTKFFDGIRDLVVGARTSVARGVDVVQVHTNFEIGRRIVEEEQRGKDRAAYGKEIIKALADRLAGEFGKGFSLSNLKSMRQFYLQNQHRIGRTEFADLPKSQSLTGQFDASPKSQSLTGQLAILQSATGKSATSPPGPFTLKGLSGNNCINF